MNERQEEFIDWINEQYAFYQHIPANNDHEIKEIEHLLLRGQDISFNQTWIDPEKHPVAQYHVDENHRKLYYRFL